MRRRLVLLGMAAFLGAGYRVPLAAVMFVAEKTGQPGFIVPALFASVAGALMYFAQGIPYGLLAIAIPAWLASQDVGAGAIGSYLAVIVLPWAFKLVTGPFMDRFQFRPMGKRRPWVLAAQLGLSLSLLALMLIENPAEQIGLLMLIGVLVNSFAATQDVAVDGMSIDLTPVREQGRLNAFMAFGKAMGWSVTSAVIIQEESRSGT